MYIEERLDKIEKTISELKAWLENLVNQAPASTPMPPEEPQNEAVGTEDAEVIEEEPVKTKKTRKTKAKKEPEPEPEFVEEANEDIIDDIFEMKVDVAQLTMEEFALKVRQAIDSPKGGKTKVIATLNKYGYKGGKLSEGFPADKCGVCAKELDTLL